MKRNPQINAEEPRAVDSRIKEREDKHRHNGVLDYEDRLSRPPRR